MCNFSTITTWGKDGEVDGFRNMLEKFPDGIMACVSDSYNIWNACEKLWGEELKDIITERGERDARLVVRPDSGNPSEVVIKVSSDFLFLVPLNFKNGKGFQFVKMEFTGVLELDYV